MLFARHVESRTNAHLEPIFNDGDPNITERGMAQARPLGIFLASRNIHTVVTSPTTRARLTWELASEFSRPPQNVTTARGLQEIKWGSWCGRMIRSEFTPAMQSRADREGLSFRPDPTAESLQEVGERMLACIQPLEHAREKEGGELLVIGHSSAIRSMIAVSLGWSRAEALAFKLPNANVIDFSTLKPHEPQPLFRPPPELAKE